MATTPLLYLNQYFSTFLNVGGGIDNSQTTGIVVQSVSGLDITKPGIACITYSNPIDTAVAEWVKYTSINGSNELQGVTRGAEGFSAKAHSNQAVIVFPLSESHINNLNAMFDTTGLDIAQIATPANPSSGRNKIYFKSDDKAYTLTSAGVEAEVGSGGGTLHETFIIAGTLATGTDVSKTFFLPFDCVLQSATPYVKTAGTTNATTFDINLNGSTIATTKLSIASGATSGSNQALDNPTTTRSAGAAITVDCDSVSTTAPIEAYIVLFYESV